jgi:hypothetical protein
MKRTLLLNPNRFIFIIICLFVSTILFGQSTASASIPGNYKFVVPCDVTSITVQVWGGGGAGGGSTTNFSRGGGGGAGGSYVSSVIAVTPGQVIACFVGNGAIGGTSAGASGVGSWVVSNTTVFAQGGAGGAAPNGLGVSNGGVGSIALSIGSTRVAGSSGGNGSGVISGAGGTGANPGGGAGGAAVDNSSNGLNGSTVGGGGGGAFVNVGTDQSGGNGGNGQVSITFTSSLLSYCSPSFNTRVDPITNVTFGGINNTTPNTITGSANLESFCMTGTVQQGCTTNAISVKGNTGGNFTDYYKAYVDWDQNGVFGNNTNEIYNLGTITNSTGVDAILTTGNISVPLSAVLGNTRMRVLKVSFVDIVDPCLTGNYYGQAEDYTINVTPVIASPSIGTITQPTCNVPTGSVALSGLPSTGTWTITASPTTAGLSGLSGTGSTTTVSGLTAGTTYIFTVSISGCPSAISANVPVNTVQTVTFNGTSWSATPSINTNGVIATTGTISTDVNLCSCTVNTGVTATVAAGTTIRLQNQLTVNGTMIFKDTSSLVQINNAAVNTGVITYERQTTPISRFDYTYYCSPVSGQTLFALSPNTLFDKFFSFNSTTDNYRPESPGNVMGLGVGYIIRGPQTFGISTPTGTYIAPFNGVPYNGNLSTPIGPAGKSNLIGNPYLSALDANLFLAANSAVLEGTIYFWTHNTSIRLASSHAAGTAGSGVLAYTSDDYAAYNRSGGVATAKAPSSTSTTGGPAPVKSNAPTGQIAAGQAFFGTSVASGNINFNNSMRVGFSGIVANSNADFFKMPSTKKTSSAVEMNRIWLDLTNTQGAFKEILLGYISDATNENESAFDGETFDGNAFVDFYSISNNKNLTIQGRALPFDNSEVVPLGYKSATAGEFGITIRDKDGLFKTQNVFLEDKLLDTEFDLSNGTYNFTTAKGTFNTRFAIRYTSKTLGLEEVDPLLSGIYISTKNKIVTVSITTDKIDKVYVYDLSGKKLFSKEAVDSNQLFINNLTPVNAVLVVKVTLNNGQVISQKILH